MSRGVSHRDTVTSSSYLKTSRRLDSSLEPKGNGSIP